MVKTILPVQRNKDEYEFQDDNSQPVDPSSPTEIENAESETFCCFITFDYVWPLYNNEMCHVLILLFLFTDIPETTPSDSDITKSDGFVEMKEQWVTRTMFLVRVIAIRDLSLCVVFQSLSR